MPRSFDDDKFKFETSISCTYHFEQSIWEVMSSSGLPHFARGLVVKGFGRGSKELGIPTANLPPDVVSQLPSQLNTGVYFGWAKVDNGPVYKMVMSVGWNPFYKNKEKSMEIHILHVFKKDFYGCTLSVCMLGYIRPEKDFDSVECLIKTIQTDIQIAEKELDKPEYLQYSCNSFFKENLQTNCDCNQNLKT